MTRLRLIEGDGDLLEALEDMKQRVLRGEVQGLVIVAALQGPELGHHWAYRDDSPHIWARLLAGVADTQYDMLRNGL